MRRAWKGVRRRNVGCGLVWDSCAARAMQCVGSDEDITNGDEDIKLVMSQKWRWWQVRLAKGGWEPPAGWEEKQRTAWISAPDPSLPLPSGGSAWALYSDKWGPSATFTEEEERHAFQHRQIWKAVSDPCSYQNHLPSRTCWHSEPTRPSCPNGPKKMVGGRPGTAPFPPQGMHRISSLPLATAAIPPGKPCSEPWQKGIFS